MRFITLKTIGGAATAAALLLGMTTSASAGDPVVSDPLFDGLAGPLQFEVSPGGKVLVGQSFSGTVSTIGRNGNLTDLFNDPGVDGVASNPHGSVVYTHTDFESGVVDLRLHTPSGGTRILGDLFEHESTENPDQGNAYGFDGLTEECTAELAGLPPEATAGILPYNGIVESHAYAIATVPWGWYVADAAGNDIVFVDWHHNVKTIAVLPPQAPVLVTAEVIEANELPPCVEGASFIAEPVPTDVEVAPNGALYVSTLPGGPEDPSLGARGSVYRINPWQGTVALVATGLAGATNLALSPDGTVYVSELFADQVSKIVGDQVVPVASVPSPSGLEWARGKLYVGTDTFGSGKIQTITP
jgi:hypothetical protein